MINAVNTFNPFHVTGLFRYPLKTSENQRSGHNLKQKRRVQFTEKNVFFTFFLIPIRLDWNYPKLVRNQPQIKFPQPTQSPNVKANNRHQI